MKYNGVNYSKQRRSADCSVVAYVNSLKWAGLKVNYQKEIDNFADVLGTTKNGTFLDNYILFFKALKKNKNFCYKINKVKNYPKLVDVNKHLDKGGAIVLTIQFGTYNYHTTFLFKRDKNSYYFVNFFKGTTISIIDDFSKYSNRLVNGVFITKRS